MIKKFRQISEELSTIDEKIKKLQSLDSRRYRKVMGFDRRPYSHDLIVDPVCLNLNLLINYLHETKRKPKQTKSFEFTPDMFKGNLMNLEKPLCEIGKDELKRMSASPAVAKNVDDLFKAIEKVKNHWIKNGFKVRVEKKETCYYTGLPIVKVMVSTRANFK